MKPACVKVKCKNCLLDPSQRDLPTPPGNSVQYDQLPYREHDQMPNLYEAGRALQNSGARNGGAVQQGATHQACQTPQNGQGHDVHLICK